MKRPAPEVLGIALALAVTGCGYGTETGTGLLTEFEYLGCAGDWNEDRYEPEVTSSGTRDAATFLVRNPGSCGYDQGSNGKAHVDGNTLELDYTLSSSGGDMAACICEYRARFLVSGVPADVTKVSVNGDEARLKGELPRTTDALRR
ncbi:hypothetical protein [uncultured Stenotrophomonas sp.]|uniref:hypothetical protein n=1 Tax=uncultured Stenotrophomonas sp. TaxID=165438 RepID=UPI0028F169F2|nr:hypothetical protein [uncultured Stenotrophomonas sp.]